MNKVGRPRNPVKRTPYCLRLSAEERKQLKAVAFYTERSMHQFIRDAIHDAFEKVVPKQR